jgi:integrase
MSKKDHTWKRIDSFTHQVSTLKKPIRYTLYEHPSSPNICYYFRYNNRTYRGSSFESEIENCHTRVKEIIYNVIQGKFPKKEKKKYLKFQDTVKNFLQSKHTKNITAKTLHEYRRQSKYLIEYFKNRDVNSIEAKDFQDYTNWRKNYFKTHKDKMTPIYKRNGKKIKGRKFDRPGSISINKENALLVSILRYSKEFMNALVGKEIPKKVVIKENHVKREALTWHEYSELKKYWEKKNPYYWKIISFVDKTGIRYPSELLRIKVSDVNLKEGTVMIRNRKSRSKDSVNTKVPLFLEAKEILQELISREGILKGADDFVFLNDKGVQIKYINKAFKKSLVKLNLNPNHTMYSLRHTFATRLIKNPNISMKVASYILGHKDTTMIDRTYSHITEKDALRAVQRIEDKNRNKKNN